MGESESTRGTKGRSDLVVGGDRAEVPGMEVIQLPNKKVDIVRGDQVILLQIIKGRRGEGCRKIPPENVDRGARVLRRAHDMHCQGVEEKGWRDMNCPEE